MLLKWNKHSSFALLLIGALSLNGCKNSVPDFEPVEIDPTLVLTLNLTNNGEVVSKDESFLDEKNFSVSPLEFKTFFAEVKLHSSEGEWIDVSEAVFFDFKPIDTTLNNPQWGNASKLYIPEGNYDRIKFGLGLPSNLNAIDPSTYENENPLSVYTAMYWTWATKYRFVILEARVDTLGAENRDLNVLFHTGLDSLYRPDLEYPVQLNLSSFDRDTLAFEIDWNKLFHSGNEVIDLAEMSVTHTTDTEEEFILAEKFTNNYASALKLKD